MKISVYNTTKINIKIHDTTNKSLIEIKKKMKSPKKDGLNRIGF